MWIKNLLLSLLLCLANTSVLAHTDIQTIDFEHVLGADAASGNNQIQALDPNYKGFIWSEDFNVITHNFFPASGYEYGAIGNWVGFTSNASTVFLTKATPFNFYGGYFASAWDNTEQVLVTGYLNGVKLYSETLTVSNQANNLPQLVSFNWRGINHLQFAPLGQQIVFDNLQIASVPEPHTYLMLVGGILLMGFIARKRI